jgi:hypothetical protein
MTINIELPPEEEEALLERARVSGRDLASYVKEIIQDHIDHGDAIAGLDDLVDHEAVAYCAREIEGKDVPSLEEVRQALAKIQGSMARAVIEERDERF